ncbi:NlpC/P60 family protein [Clostridium estertheticum]|uniref:C40 family peptidase n=1 Tax=Clostridium estertheticum TaxID=238834 RepID=UPI0013EEE4EB|nr:C40 family peptidase [Clostridium estertheticum]MBZ9606252.1 NlpC/P60 family protein [Clostridium estertheticum]
MRKKIISLIVTIGLAATINIQVLADPLSDKLSNQKGRLEEQKNEYKKIQDNVADIEISIEKLDSTIGKMGIEVDKTKDKIGETQKQIEKTTKDIQVAEANIKEEEDLFNKRMRSMYMNGADSYLEVLLDSEGVEDLISRVDNIKKIVEYDNKIIGQLTAEKSKIENKKVVLEAEKTKLLVLKTDNENKIGKLKEKKQEQDALIKEAEKKKQLYAGKISDGQATVDATMKQIQQIRDNAAKTAQSNVTPSRGSGSASLSSNAIVAYASNYLGTPYVWGAAGPEYFDCSGFMQHIYNHFGVSLSRTTYTQINEGSYVSREALQPGDLIFFGSASDPHHVGMYVGNNSYIHAPRTGDVIKISELTRGDYLTARRVK